jgi:hypothetical protein|tara:strand:+ start:1399 stop:1581 length:183 start_codon:yes stop_codon:yes gene_type:complete
MPTPREIAASRRFEISAFNTVVFLILMAGKSRRFDWRTIERSEFAKSLFLEICKPLIMLS